MEDSPADISTWHSPSKKQEVSSSPASRRLRIGDRSSLEMCVKDAKTRAMFASLVEDVKPLAECNFQSLDNELSLVEECEIDLDTLSVFLAEIAPQASKANLKMSTTSREFREHLTGPLLDEISHEIEKGKAERDKQIGVEISGQIYHSQMPPFDITHVSGSFCLHLKVTPSF